MSCRPHLTFAGFGVFDAAKLQLFPDMARKSFINARANVPKARKPINPTQGAESSLCGVSDEKNSCVLETHYMLSVIWLRALGAHIPPIQLPHTALPLVA